MKQTQVLVLAAGKGKRMGGGDASKVLEPVLGKPIISWLVEAVERSLIDPQLAIVVGHGAELVRKTLGGKHIYIEQKELLGTGQAVMEARKALEGRCENIMIFYGDHPFISPRTMKDLRDAHLREGRVLTMITTTAPDFNDWRAPLYDFGRIVRDSQGRIIRIVEVKDATMAEREIRELNPAMYCFRADWLWPRLPKLRNDNAQGEYYLTDLVGMAMEEGEEIATVPIDPKECLGVNSKEQLELVEKLFAHLKE